MTCFQLCFAPLCFLIAGTVVLRAARRLASFWRGVLWGSVWALGGILILWPDVTTDAASFLGIGRGTDLVLYVGTLMGMYALQCLYGTSRQLENMLTEVIRQQAIHTASIGDAKPSRTDTVVNVDG